jgi:hypothetical protein
MMMAVFLSFSIVIPFGGSTGERRLESGGYDRKIHGSPVFSLPWSVSTFFRILV